MRFLNGPDDCVWLRETHLRNTPDLPPFQSFTFEGNEDCPLRIHLYAEEEPFMWSTPVKQFSLRVDTRTYKEEL
jgi:hypothetical protein